ncbi:MAG TPA: MBOAT family protein [Burkholderiaceae bacterium]|nr:MBOAT family protein [Burkholderiaceae bacterium]
MLFNSLEFLLFYLPLVVAGFFWLGRVNQQLAAAWLAAASLFFYGYWDHRYLLLLGGSIAFNFFAGYGISRASGAVRKQLLGFAIAVNLLAIAYYKYADFFILTVNAASDAGIPLLNVALPIGISFFTFTQIAFLVDTYQGKVQEYRFVHYVLFVTYFPHLIAGPVLHHREMMPQFAESRIYRASALSIAVGISIFAVGLAKKVLIADNIAPLANHAFEPNASPQLLDAWLGVLAYTFQLYFDFSGYSDMAIGLSRMFGIRLPLNFNSPYKAESISEFWRRWHMSLSRFLRDYLYVPLGGNRSGPVGRYRNLMITMLLGGLWHGAGWTFVVWGALHGVYLVINHSWQALVRRLNWRTGNAYRWSARCLTFAAVAFAWVFFRAVDFTTAISVIKGLGGAHGVLLPEVARTLVAPLGALGLQPSFGWSRSFDAFGLAVLATAMLLAFFAPNTQEIFRRFEPCLEQLSEPRDWPWLAWMPSRLWSIGLAVMLCACILSLNRPSNFLYFQF